MLLSHVLSNPPVPLKRRRHGQKFGEGLDKIDVMKARCTHICGLCSLAMFAAIVLFSLHGRDYESPATWMGWTSFWNNSYENASLKAMKIPLLLNSLQC